MKDFFIYWGKQLFFLLAIIAVLVIITSIGLRIYTHHGDEVLVPSVSKLYVEEANRVLASRGLRLEVIDSTHTAAYPLGMIIEQNPPADSHIKKNRTVYVIVNARSRRAIPLPDINNFSLRQAQATLVALSLPVNEVQYVPSDYKDLVLGMKVGEKTVEPGQRVYEGTPITLIVGKGTVQRNIRIPNLKGKTLANAKSILQYMGLQLGSVLNERDDELFDFSESEMKRYKIFWQRPADGTMVLNGTQVNVKVTTKDVIHSTRKQEDEEFF